MYYDPISSGYIGILPEGPLVILVEVFEALKLVYLEVVLPQPSLVTLVHPSGKKIEVDPLKSRDVPQVYNLSNLKEKTLFDVPVVCEYPDVFPEECWRSLSIHFIPCLTLIMA